jgi:hypothetical protein
MKFIHLKINIIFEKSTYIYIYGAKNNTISINAITKVYAKRRRKCQRCSLTHFFLLFLFPKKRIGIGYRKREIV